MPWIQMNILIWLLLCWGHRLRVVCGEGVSRCIEDHAVSSVNLFVILQWGLHVLFRTLKPITYYELRLSHGNCILVEGYVVQVISFYP
jgi:hypothetical protein